MSGLSLDFVRERYRQHRQLLNFSATTIYTQDNYLNRLAEFMFEVSLDDVAALDEEALASFQRWLFYRPTHRGVARGVAGQNRILSLLRSLFAFLQQEGLIAHNPAATLRAAREPSVLPKVVLTVEEARRLLEAPDLGTAIGYRDRCIMEVLYATGIRKAELLSLKVEDINLEDELLMVRKGKGGKDRVVPLSGVACRFLENYVKVIRPELLRGHQTEVLFVSLRRGFTLGAHSLGTLITDYCRKVGLKKKVTPHLWRHTCATHLLKNNANLRHVQEMLGHKMLCTTEKYLRVTITDLKEAHKKFHPREKGCSVL